MRPLASFADVYTARRAPVISFEVFPPKTDAGLEHLRSIVPGLARLNPAFVTVTYGAFGTTRERTLEIARFIQKEFHVPAACHLTCVGSSRDELTRIIREIHAAGIRNIVALRGDPPSGELAFVASADGFAHANELVAHIRTLEKEEQLGPFGIAVAGYPEKHLEAPDFQTDLANLKHKVDAGADCVVTQLFYANDHFFRFVDSAAAMGVSVPIVPGLLPIVSAKQIVRITSMCGSRLPPELRAELEAVGDDLGKAEEIGIRQCIAQATELLRRGVPGLHFYVLNKASHMQQIMAGLRPVLEALASAR